MTTLIRCNNKNGTKHSLLLSNASQTQDNLFSISTIEAKKETLAELCAQRPRTKDKKLDEMEKLHSVNDIISKLTQVATACKKYLYHMDVQWF